MSMQSEAVISDELDNRVKNHQWAYKKGTSIETAFTRCRHILKTMKKVTVAKFELAFTRCRHNLKTVGNLTIKTRWRN